MLLREVRSERFGGHGATRFWLLRQGRRPAGGCGEGARSGWHPVQRSAGVEQAVARASSQSRPHTAYGRALFGPAQSRQWLQSRSSPGNGDRGQRLRQGDSRSQGCGAVRVVRRTCLQPPRGPGQGAPSARSAAFLKFAETLRAFVTAMAKRLTEEDLGGFIGAGVLPYCYTGGRLKFFLGTPSRARACRRTHVFSPPSPSVLWVRLS